MERRGNADATIEVLGGRYQLEGCIGSGNMGAVWRAYDLRMRRHVAIKRLHRREPDAALRFEREMQALARLRHPNIVSVFDTGTTPRGDAYLVMELVPGITLADRIRTGGPLAIEPAVDIAGQMARGLRAAHAENIVHRDLKPSNIMLSQESGEPDRVKLLDFGVSRLVDATQQSLSGAHFIGTPMYASPEQARGEEATPSSDLYCLGSVLYEMLVGRPPFYAETAMGALFQHAHAAPSVPSSERAEIPKWLDELVLQLLHKQQQARPSAQSMLALLDARRVSAVARHRVVATDSLGSGTDHARERNAPTTLGDRHPLGSMRPGLELAAAWLGKSGRGASWLGIPRRSVASALAVGGSVLVAVVGLGVLRPMLFPDPGIGAADVPTSSTHALNAQPPAAIVIDDFESADVRPSGNLFSLWEGYRYLTTAEDSGSWHGTAFWKVRGRNSNRALRFGWRIADPRNGRFDRPGAVLQVRPANDFVDLSNHSRMVLRARYDTDVGWPAAQATLAPEAQQALGDSMNAIPREHIELLNAELASPNLYDCAHTASQANVSFQCREHGTVFAAGYDVSADWTTIVIQLAALRQPLWSQKDVALKDCLSVVDIISFGALTGRLEDGACHSGALSLDDISIR